MFLGNRINILEQKNFENFIEIIDVHDNNNEDCEITVEKVLKNKF